MLWGCRCRQCTEKPPAHGHVNHSRIRCSTKSTRASGCCFADSFNTTSGRRLRVHIAHGLYTAAEAAKKIPSQPTTAAVASTKITTTEITSCYSSSTAMEQATVGTTKIRNSVHHPPHAHTQLHNYTTSSSLVLHLAQVQLLQCRKTQRSMNRACPPLLGWNVHTRLPVII